MAYVNTTFLPKTNGLVFQPRLEARSDKGRVFGLVDGTDNPIPPGDGDSDAIATTVPGITGDPLVGETLSAIPPDVTAPVGFVYSGFNYTWGYYQTDEVIGEGETYEVQPEDVGKKIVVVASVAAARSIDLPSPPTPPVDWKPLNPQIITPPPAVLSFTIGQEGEYTAEFSYEYKRNGSCWRFYDPKANKLRVINIGQIEKYYPGTRADIYNAHDNKNGIATLRITWWNISGGYPTNCVFIVEDINKTTGETLSVETPFTISVS